MQTTLPTVVRTPDIPHPEALRSMAVLAPDEVRARLIEAAEYIENLEKHIEESRVLEASHA